MTADRPYRKALTVEEAVAELRRCSGTQFDAAIVEALISVIEERGQRPVDADVREPSLVRT
jgi:HD-GYP domain-containing protein (c-di-GMP phosphodiesterase class II)